ncbi:hypothetical protein DNU06_11910 [Putridiphycobacter roseus]|uniref:DUF4175 domain-containing protein n=1 Tax=Putridiphycobacter roseus TaxID=2219161 RepID=A0A2W1NBU2_9FLAO|nr:DUF4175 family protein [Putridiphycobacter roseus]PZE16553.1 hypothetical protein DNU06_11910 [Putridiphycobacter roseus]
MGKFQDLLLQIESFIRKYYKNEMIKGGFLFLSIFLLSFLVVSTLEYFGRFNGNIRSFLFFSFLLVNGYVLIRYIIIPFLKLFNLGDRLNENEASQLIGKLFPDVGDKLENTLQLKTQLNTEQYNYDLVEASINQKADALSVIPFTTGIQLSNNKKYLKYLLPILFVIFLILLIRPSIFSDGSKRLVNYNMEFVEKAPFEFILKSADSVIQGRNYTLEIKLNGSEIPKEVKIVSSNGTYNLTKQNNLTFVHDFANLGEDLNFYCEANGFKSQQFTVNVLQKPVLDGVKIKLNYPKHTGMAADEISDLSDLTIPEGTRIEWLLSSQNTVKMVSKFEDTSLSLLPNANHEFKFNQVLRASQTYNLLFSTKQLLNADTLSNQIVVIADHYPSIEVEEQMDSLQPLQRFFSGNIQDDYGFKTLTAIVKTQYKDSAAVNKYNIPILAQQTNQTFAYSLDFKSLQLKPGSTVDYYFVVRDNDAPNGYKSTTSSVLTYRVAELSELENDLSEQSENLKKEMNAAIKDAKALKEDIKSIKNNLINKTTPDWKDKQSMNNMLNLQKDLQQKLEQLNQQLDQKAQQEEEFLQNSEELKAKQEMLEKLMEDLMDDEMKALLEELEKMMEEMNKDDILKNMEKMEQKSNKLEDELDRTLEIFKNLELDKKIESIEEQLRELAEKQNALEEATKDKKESAEKLEEQQESLNSEFEEIKKDMEEAKQMNEELEKPKDLDFNKEEEQQIEKEMQDAKENLGDSKEKKAAQNQEKAADMMEKMADDVQAMLSAAAAQQEGEDMEKLRFLLENIVALSFQQENLMENYDLIDQKNPLLISYNRKQLQINQSTLIVKDSLLALAKRQPQISNTILSHLNDLDFNQEKVMGYGHDRNLSKVMHHQQYAVTSYNELALLLAEALEQMQEAMKNKMPGSGQCDKPGGSGKGKPSSQMSMEQMKSQLKKQMEQMKNGENPGGKEGKKPGEGSGMGTQGDGQGSIPGLSAKEVAKMAMEQAQMRKALQNIRQELNKDGSGAGNGLNPLIEDLEKLENDLLNNGYTNNMLKRQQDIMTRLLENEKAIMERGFSEERESKSGKNLEEGNQNKLIEYNQKKEAEIELLRTLPVGLRVYYKNMVNNYFNTVNN